MGLIRVGLDTKPLLPPRAGVARYLVGLLAGLEALADPTVAVEPLRPAGPRRTLPWTLWSLQRASGRGLSALHCPFYYPPLAPRCPVTVVVHDVLFLEHPEWFPAGWRNPLRLLVPLGARRAAAIVTSTEHNATVISARCRVARERIRVIPWGVERAVFAVPQPAAIEATRTRLGLRGPYLLQVGALEPRRGIDLAIAAAAALRGRLAGLELVLAGEARMPVPALADAPAWVRRLGRVPDGELAALYAGAEGVLAPSRGEGFDLPVLEALASGAAVVASDIPVHVELFRPAVELFPCGDAAGLAAALGRLAGDPARTAALRRAGPALAGRFSWVEAARRHVELWREVAA